jgi:hypothetical protein
MDVKQSFSIREAHRLRVSGNRVQRIFGPKRKEVTRGWRKISNEEFHNLCSSLNITRMTKSRRMRWVGNLFYSPWITGKGLGGTAATKCHVTPANESVPLVAI